MGLRLHQLKTRNAGSHSAACSVITMGALQLIMRVAVCCALGAGVVEVFAEEVLVTPQVHSSVELQYGDVVIQVDPWGVAGSDRYSKADLILVTDSPSHHLDLDLIEKIRKPHATIIAPANSVDLIPGAIAMNNGDMLRVAGMTIEAVAAYDIIEGSPKHPKGDANGYVVNVGGKLFFFAGVTECVEEVSSLRNIEVAFLPMNIPPGRMTPTAAADCAKIINPAVVYIYHFDQSYPRRASSGNPPPSPVGDMGRMVESIDEFAEAISESDVEFKRAEWYPAWKSR